MNEEFGSVMANMVGAFLGKGQIAAICLPACRLRRIKKGMIIRIIISI